MHVDPVFYRFVQRLLPPICYTTSLTAAHSPTVSVVIRPPTTPTPTHLAQLGALDVEHAQVKALRVDVVLKRNHDALSMCVKECAHAWLYQCGD